MVKEQQLSLVAAECSIPAYCVKTVGSRHILIGGGGGSAKTGVLNQLQV
jgi:Flp pilus assembly CpaF family ATPase